MLSTFCAEVALALREHKLVARRHGIEALFRRFGGALRLERPRFTSQLEFADAQALHMSEALVLSGCPLAGDAFEETSTLTLSPLNRPEAALVLRAGLVTLGRALALHQATEQ
jgi:hypothetical protein